MDLLWLQVKMRFFLLILSLVATFTIRAWGAEDQEFFKAFESPFMQVLPDSAQVKSTYPWWAKALQFEFLKFDPKGRPVPMLKECDPDLVVPEEHQDSLGWVKSYLQRCEPELETRWIDPISNTLLTVGLKLSPASHPFAHHVMFHLPGGVNVKGLLGLKSDGVKRPLVILRLGIFSNTLEFFPERFLFMQLFEQSPFNILVLESLSGSEFVEHNETFSIGGVEEGLQNFWIAKQLQNSNEPLSELIDSVHMVGVSLGGNGVFFAALLNQWNQKPISSFMAFCPLVNFAETFNFHRAHPWSMKIMNFWANARLPKLKVLYPGVSKENFLGDVFEKLKLEQRPLPAEYSALSLPANFAGKSFLERLDFWSDWKNLQTPFLVLASKNDPIVPFQINSERLLNKKIDTGNSKLEVVSLPQGIHCSLPAAYKWNPMTSVLQKYIKMNSKAWTAQKSSFAVDFKVESMDKVSWEAESDGVFMAYGSWGDYRRLPFPLRDNLPYKLKFPLTSEARSLVQRWLAQNVKIGSFSESKNFGGLPKTELVWEY
jgi:predicted alpha/beta-fold hydrolase